MSSTGMRVPRMVLRRGRNALAAVVPIADLRLQELEDQEDLRDMRAALKRSQA